MSPTHRALLSEMITQVRSNLDEVTAAYWADAPAGGKPDLYGVLTRAAWAVQTEIRKLNADYFMTFRNSTDSTVTIYGVTYDTASFAIVAGTKEYTLPGDLLELRVIECITSGYEGIVFDLSREITHPEFRSLRSLTTSQSPTRFLARVVGERTLMLSHASDTALDLKIGYISSACIYATATPTSAPIKAFATATDELVMPWPGSSAVEEVATARAMVQDRNGIAAVYATLADATVARLFGAHNRESDAPQFVAGMFE